MLIWVSCGHLLESNYSGNLFLDLLFCITLIARGGKSSTFYTAVRGQVDFFGNL